MTIWDDIYKKYQNGGDAWASLSEGIHPKFIEFLQEESFTVKHALDIGCGTGKYLKLLLEGGFITDGIDSSETAVSMTQQAINRAGSVKCADMYEYSIPGNIYDLILSISTIQHGTKTEIVSLINKIHVALRNDGRIFITVPDIESSTKWNTFKDKEYIAEGTFVPLSGPEKGLPHSFFTQAEVQCMFSSFSHVRYDLDDIGRWIIRAGK